MDLENFIQLSEQYESNPSEQTYRELKKAEEELIIEHYGMVSIDCKHPIYYENKSLCVICQEAIETFPEYAREWTKVREGQNQS